MDLPSLWLTHECLLVNRKWNSAITDFTELLRQNPTDSRARMYRGRAHTQLKQWEAALEDLSAAVHHNPNNALAYYYRACLLRKYVSHLLSFLNYLLLPLHLCAHFVWGRCLTINTSMNTSSSNSTSSLISSLILCNSLRSSLLPWTSIPMTILTI